MMIPLEVLLLLRIVVTSPSLKQAGIDQATTEVGPPTVQLSLAGFFQLASFEVTTALLFFKMLLPSERLNLSS